ncbi:MAG: hypothetical protein ABIP30_02280 [Ferruginibacter sp.]
MTAQNKNILLSLVYFLLATVITGIFIANKFWLYSSENAMILSGSIAAVKWLIQIVAAFIFLKELKWVFIRRIAFVCFIGSVILFVYYIFNFLPLPLGGFSQFILSIGLSVLVMIAMYYRAVKKTGLSITWFLGWILCLIIAITLQVFVVF